MRNSAYRFLILCILASFLLFPVQAKAAEEELLLNTDFISADQDSIPSGWNVDSYLGAGYSLSCGDGIIYLSSSEKNDLRLVQKVSVKSDTVYCLSAEISSHNVINGRGATLSIDNYSIDGSYIYSESVSGSTDWTAVDLYFRTGPNQNEIKVALRLGGYSEVSSGTAGFRNVRLYEADGAGKVVKNLFGDSSSQSGSVIGSSGDLSEARQIALKSYLHLFVILALVYCTVMCAGFYRKRSQIRELTLTPQTGRRIFFLCVLLGIIVRSVMCSLWGGHDSDMSCWTGWGNYIASHGTSTFYTAPGHEWYDYPPGYMLILGLISSTLRVLDVSYGSDFAAFAYMIPAVIADFGCAAVLMKYSMEERAPENVILFLGLYVILNPAVAFLSGGWGQIDSILSFFLLLAFVLLLRDHRVAAGIMYGLAIMIKWQALIYGPVLAAAFLLRVRTKRDLLLTVASVASAFAVIFLVSLPFKGNQPLFWLLQKFFSASSGYDYASVEAYNFLALIGGNWKPSSQHIIGFITYKGFGTVMIIAAVGISIWMQIRESCCCGEQSKSSAANEYGILFLSAAFCMYMIFTFGHYMHERYVFPVIFLLLFAYVHYRDPRLLLCSIFLSSVLLLNETTAMYVISELASAVVRSGREHQAVIRICSFAETASFFYFAYVCCSILYRRKNCEA